MFCVAIVKHTGSDSKIVTPLGNFRKLATTQKPVLVTDFYSYQIRRWHIQQNFFSNLSDLGNIIALNQAANDHYFEAKNANGF